MQVKIWGCRGSMATPGPETIRTGGNTTCVEVTANGSRVILDAGTGIRALGAELAEDGPQKINICLTHLHLDHIEGLGFFAPFYDPDSEVSVWGPPSSVRTLKERISRYLSSPLFPIEVSDLPARVTFLDAPDGPWEIDGLRLQAHRSRIQGRRSATASNPTAPPSRSFPTTSRRSVSRWSRSPVTGSRGSLSRTARRSCSTTLSTPRTSTPSGSVGVTPRSARR